MAKSSKRTITLAKPAAKAAKRGIPAPKPAKLALSKPAKPAASVLPTAPKTATGAIVAPKAKADKAPSLGFLGRVAQTVAGGAYPFAVENIHDGEYLRFFGSVMRPLNHTATLQQINAAGTDRGKKASRANPYYTGSASNAATNAGYINRLAKAGYITQSDSGNTLSATAKARATAEYNRKA